MATTNLNYQGFELNEMMLRAIETFMARAQSGQIGANTSFADLMDAATANLPAINASLAFALQAKADAAALAAKQDKLNAGANIVIDHSTNTVSATAQPASFTNITGDPADNAALVALIEAKINGTITIDPDGTIYTSDGAIYTDDGLLLWDEL